MMRQPEVEDVYFSAWASLILAIISNYLNIFFFWKLRMILYFTQKKKGTAGVIEIHNPNLVKPKNVKAKDVDVRVLFHFLLCDHNVSHDGFWWRKFRFLFQEMNDSYFLRKVFYGSRDCADG